MAVDRTGRGMGLISVIIPTFNRAVVVTQAIESVLAQAVETEVIVVDDGSIDGTADALAPLMDRIRYVRTENGGVSAARNRGIIEARGEWVAFLDSDDLWSAEKLQRQTECIERTGADVCFCVSVDERGESLDDLALTDLSLPAGGMRAYPPEDCRFFRARTHPFVQSMLVRRHALARVGMFDPTLRVAEDTDLVYRLVLAYGYAVVNEPLVTICRRRSTAGLSDSMDAPSAFKRHDCYVRVQASVYWRLAQLDAGAATLARRRMLYFASRQAEIACALGDRPRARRMALAALDLRADWKSTVRNLLIWAAYPLIGGHFAAKWSR
jgi:glycosyltransferase involved in cell wall biosynthesis